MFRTFTKHVLKAPLLLLPDQTESLEKVYKIIDAVFLIEFIIIVIMYINKTSLFNITEFLYNVMTFFPLYYKLILVVKLKVTLSVKL